jgi:hypothetical protein
MGIKSIPIVNCHSSGPRRHDFRTPYPPYLSIPLTTRVTNNHHPQVNNIIGTRCFLHSAGIGCAIAHVPERWAPMSRQGGHRFSDKDMREFEESGAPQPRCTRIPAVGEPPNVWVPIWFAVTREKAPIQFRWHPPSNSRVRLRANVPALDVTAIILYSMTSSARASNKGGTVSSSAFAVFRFMISSNFRGAWIGSSATVAPLRIRPA